MLHIKSKIPRLLATGMIVCSLNSSFLVGAKAINAVHMNLPEDESVLIEVVNYDQYRKIYMTLDEEDISTEDREDGNDENKSIDEENPELYSFSLREILDRKEDKLAEMERERLRNVDMLVGYIELGKQGGLLDIDNPDSEYINQKISITGADREMAEALIYGESGDQGFIGCCIVAQAMKDYYLMYKCSTMNDVRIKARYDGSVTSGTNEDAKRAAAFIFDQGGYAVKHRVLYFYNPTIVSSQFHESQEFVLQYKSVRFFDKK